MARIRTIKPEFWSHPIMSKLDDSTKLLAIALLNLADDEGFFNANDRIVRNFARPFDANLLKTNKCLSKLEAVGYISLSKHDSMGTIGYINKFTKNQVINHPQKSHLKQYYSGNITVIEPEDYYQEKEKKVYDRKRKDVKLLKTKPQILDFLINTIRQPEYLANNEIVLHEGEINRHANAFSNYVVNIDALGKSEQEYSRWFANWYKQTGQK